jgi:hypothetical protein
MMSAKTYFAERISSDIATRIDAFWNSFVAHRSKIDAYLRGDRSFDLPRFMIDGLATIAPNIMWEFSGWEKGHRLCLTAEHRLGLTVLVHAICQRAPKLIDFAIFEGRIAIPPADLPMLMEGRTRKPFQIESWAVKPGQINCIDVDFTAQRGNLSDDELSDQASIALEFLLGEEKFKVWGGFVNPAPGLLPLKHDQVAESFSAKIETAYATLPTWPHSDPRWDEAPGIVAGSDSEEAADYPNFSDIQTISSSRDDFVQGLAGGIWWFRSERYSRFGETFCYLKIEDDNLRLTVAERGKLEDRLNLQLRGPGYGGSVGGGSGRRYAYIFLALADIAKGVDTVLATARAANVPKRSWLMCFDNYLTDQFLPVWPDSPPPPQRPRKN